jgi:Family of unknown function (DUF5923)
LLIFLLSPQVIIECQKHDDYQESIKWLLSYAEEYAGHGKTIAGHGKESHAALTSVSLFLPFYVRFVHKVLFKYLPLLRRMVV